MNEDIRQLLTAFKAAVRIGHTESLDFALDDLVALPQVTGNPTMSAVFINQAILPIGRVLASRPLAVELVSDMSDSTYAAIRAICGVALALRYLANQEVDEKWLHKIASDNRDDVRQVVQLALLEAGATNKSKLTDLAAHWLSDPSPRVQSLALLLLPITAQQALAQVTAMGTPTDPMVKNALSETLTALAQQGQANEVLQLLGQWAPQGEAYAWVICKTLASSWAAKMPQETLAIMGNTGEPYRAGKTDQEYAGSPFTARRSDADHGDAAALAQ